MKKSPDVLSGIVRLKRQHAEQRVVKIQNQINALDKEILLKRDSLKQLDSKTSGDVGADFRQRSAIIAGTLKQIEALTLSRAPLLEELASARSAFQNVIFSENQLADMHAARRKKS